MNEPARQAHWRKVYKEKGEKQVSWFQEKPAISLELIHGCLLYTSDAADE